MADILVNLCVPTISKNYDVFLPATVAINRLMPMLISGVIEVSEKAYFSSGCEVLFSVEQNMVFQPNCCLADYNIGDGASLILL